MNPQSGRLLRRSALRPDESLPSLLARVADLNHYDSPTLVYRLCLIDSSPREQAVCPTRADIFEATSQLTGLDAQALYAATAHRFAACLTRPEDPLETWTLPDGETVPRLANRNLPKQLRSMFAAQFCPMCLQREPYHRLTWLPIAWAACLEHQCLLVDRCPGCQSLISIRAIIQAQCERCQADLRRARSISTARDPVGMLAQHALHTWLMDGPRPDDDTLGLPSGQPSAMLYQFVTDLRWRSLQAGTGWKHLHHIPGSPKRLVPPSLATHTFAPPDQHYRLTATAFKALLNWPQEFHAFLDAYGRHDRLQGKPALPLDQRDLYAQWCSKQWKHPTYQFVRLAFEEYLIMRYPETAFSTAAHQHRNCPIRSEQFAWIAVTEAAQLLQIPPKWLTRWVGLGRLIPLRSIGCHRATCDFVRRADVLALRRQWHEPLSLREAAWWLGLPTEVVQTLVKTGRLVAECAPATTECLTVRISKQSVVDFWSILMNKSQFQVEVPSKAIELRWIIYGLGYTGVSANAILDRVLSGQLPVYRPQSSSGGLDELQFAQQDLRETTWSET